jgi:DNA helicase-2/ATP-dependent DNA helicase PcrA
MFTLDATLTDAQTAAVTHRDGPLLILAGPGSGKTRVITQRIAHMVEQGIPPRHILALTFTNKAAEEMKTRLQILSPQATVWMGTFHRFCARLLRQYASLAGLAENYTIFDTDDSKRLLKLVLNDMPTEKQLFTVDNFTRTISWAKNKLITPAQYTPADHSQLGLAAAKVYAKYQERLLASNAVDFDDLLVHVATMLRENPELRATLDERWQYIMVDEYQDTNLAQYAIVRALSIDHANLAVTGDPDQSIYGWRGANLRNILDFEKDYPEVNVVRLEQNYRSTKSILRVADCLIVNNRKRKHKDLYTDNQEGLPARLIVYPTQQEEAESIAAEIAEAVESGRRKASDHAIFYRTNALSRTLENALRLYGVPYQIINGVEFYHRKEIKDVIAYLQLINNPQNDVALMRVINTPTRGIGKATIERLQKHANRYGMPLLSAAREAGLVETIPKRSATAVAKFVAMYDRLSLRAAAPVEEILGHVLIETAYDDILEASDDPADQDRLANIQELLTAAREFDEQNPIDSPLETFLEQAALVNDTDEWETETDKATLMTLHAAKGLEFPVVFIVAVESGLLPHERSKDDPDKLEEERRLLFVGITRAEQELQLSLANSRSFRGQRWPTVPSPFLMELPREEMELREMGSSRMQHSQWDEAQSDDAYFDPGHDQDLGVDQSAAASSDLSFDFGANTSSQINTAADLLRDDEPSTEADSSETVYPAESFTQGMTVVHKEYGPGKIIALSGPVDRRVATVNFVTAGQVKLRLDFAPLRPVGM